MVSLLKHHKMKRLKEPPPFQVPESEFCWHLKRCPKTHSYSKLSWTSLWGFKMNLKFTLFFCWCLVVWTEGPESMERGHGQLRMMSPQASSPPSPSAMSRGRGFASWCFCPKPKKNQGGLTGWFLKWPANDRDMTVFCNEMRSNRAIGGWALASAGLDSTWAMKKKGPWLFWGI